MIVIEDKNLKTIRFHVKKLEKEQIKSKVRKRKEIRIRAEIDTIENRKSIGKKSTNRKLIHCKDQ